MQKRDTGRLYAMKYVSRSACVGRGALAGVLKEVELLSSLEHPFLVNLWYSFQGRCRGASFSSDKAVEEVKQSHLKRNRKNKKKRSSGWKNTTIPCTPILIPMFPSPRYIVLACYFTPHTRKGSPPQRVDRWDFLTHHLPPHILPPTAAPLQHILGADGLSACRSVVVFTPYPYSVLIGVAFSFSPPPFYSHVPRRVVVRPRRGGPLHGVRLAGGRRLAVSSATTGTECRK